MGARAAALAALLGIASCTPFSPAVRQDFVPSLVQLNTISAGTQPDAAVYNNKAYVVFIDNGKVYLTTSSDGVYWTAAQAVSGSDTVISQPSVLVVSDAARVVMWKINGHTLRYYYTDAGGVAHGPTTLSYDSYEPYAAANTGTEIHLAYGSELSLEYVSFAFNQPAAPATGTHTFAAVGLCLSMTHTYVTHPAIAARNTLGGPEVVLAYYVYTNETAGCQASDPPPQRYAGPAAVVLSQGSIVQRASVFSPLNTVSTSNLAPEPNALSLSADNNGVYYLAASDVVDSVSRVMFASGTAPAGPQWANSTANSSPAAPQGMNIAANTNASGSRTAALAYTQLNLPNSYGPTYRQSVTWPAGSATPVRSAPVLLDSMGRYAKVANMQVCVAPGRYYVMTTVFERLVSGVPKITSDSMPAAFCHTAEVHNSTPN